MVWLTGRFWSDRNVVSFSGTLERLDGFGWRIQVQLLVRVSESDEYKAVWRCVFWLVGGGVLSLCDVYLGWGGCPLIDVYLGWVGGQGGGSSH